MTLNVFSAGVAGKIAKMVAEDYKKNTGNEVNLVIGGSVAGINRLLAGEKFDVMILADASNIPDLLGPEYVDAYDIFAGNEMVVIGNKVTADNWKDLLLDENVKIRHMNPFDDPGGYRAVMALQLSEFYEPRLSTRILEKKNYNGTEREAYDNTKPLVKKPPFLGMEDNEVFIAYRSLAVANGLNFAELPAIMNLGKRVNEPYYNKVSFVVDGGEEVFGTTILHAALMPKNAEHKKEAEEFYRTFLETDFTSYGFTDEQEHMVI